MRFLLCFCTWMMAVVAIRPQEIIFYEEGDKVVDLGEFSKNLVNWVFFAVPEYNEQFTLEVVGEGGLSLAGSDFKKNCSLLPGYTADRAFRTSLGQGNVTLRFSLKKTSSARHFRYEEESSTTQDLTTTTTEEPTTTTTTTTTEEPTTTTEEPTTTTEESTTTTTTTATDESTTATDESTTTTATEAPETTTASDDGTTSTQETTGAMSTAQSTAPANALLTLHVIPVTVSTANACPSGLCIIDAKAETDGSKTLLSISQRGDGIKVSWAASSGGPSCDQGKEGEKFRTPGTLKDFEIEISDENNGLALVEPLNRDERGQVEWELKKIHHGATGSYNGSVDSAGWHRISVSAGAKSDKLMQSLFYSTVEWEGVAKDGVHFFAQQHWAGYLNRTGLGVEYENGSCDRKRGQRGQMGYANVHLMEEEDEMLVSLYLRQEKHPSAKVFAGYSACSSSDMPAKDAETVEVTLDIPAYDYGFANLTLGKAHKKAVFDITLLDDAEKDPTPLVLRARSSSPSLVDCEHSHERKTYEMAMVARSLPDGKNLWVSVKNNRSGAVDNVKLRIVAAGRAVTWSKSAATCRILSKPNTTSFATLDASEGRVTISIAKEKLAKVRMGYHLGSGLWPAKDIATGVRWEDGLLHLPNDVVNFRIENQGEEIPLEFTVTLSSAAETTAPAVNGTGEVLVTGPDALAIFVTIIFVFIIFTALAIFTVGKMERSGQLLVEEDEFE